MTDREAAKRSSAIGKVLAKVVGAYPKAFYLNLLEIDWPNDWTIGDESSSVESLFLSNNNKEIVNISSPTSSVESKEIVNATEEGDYYDMSRNTEECDNSALIAHAVNMLLQNPPEHILLHPPKNSDNKKPH